MGCYECLEDIFGDEEEEENGEEEAEEEEVPEPEPILGVDCSQC